MKSQFPDAPTTFSNEMFIAAMDKDSKEVRAVYELYLKKFDNIPGQKELIADLYSETMAAAQR